MTDTLSEKIAAIKAGLEGVTSTYHVVRDPAPEGRTFVDNGASAYADIISLDRQTVGEIADRLGSAEARVKALEAHREKLERVLTWYGENARLCRLIHSEGDLGRNNLAADGGERARAALEGK